LGWGSALRFSDVETKVAQEHCRAWVFVSATLGDDEHLSWFTQPCGLQDAEVLRIGSPFDYARQAALYVPPHLVRPADAAHGAQVAQLAGDAAARLGGRTMVLTTTLRALRHIGDLLVERFGSDAGIEVLVQGTLPKRALMERFRQGGEGGSPGCVLVASASFWEGVDMPGQALQLVIIDKLPFPPPGDPLVEARCRRIESQGRNAFIDYSVPEAAVALKQGAGRLIRRETDTGLLVICDTRLTRMGYGRRLLAALPPMRRLHTPAEFDATLDQLAG
jgi:ATP-dependent DNA helicase DinG